MHYLTKRAFDVAVAALLLVPILSPLFLISSPAAIKLDGDSRGPIHFTAPRASAYGQKAFTRHKFRTMRQRCRQLQEEMEALNEVGGAIFKMRDDPRVTR